MYNELIKRLRDIARSDGNIKSNYIGLSLLQAADAIENTSKAYQMMAEAYEAEVTNCRWIPVSEHLPKAERKSYWVCTDTGYQCQCRWTNNLFGFGESDEWGFSIFDIPQYQKVVAWRVLPQPYEPPKEEI